MIFWYNSTHKYYFLWDGDQQMPIQLKLNDETERRDVDDESEAIGHPQYMLWLTTGRF